MSSVSPSKLCIFCGKPPIAKNKEHLFPRWLIKLTGDPKRLISFKTLPQYQKPIAFDQFTFPACQECNSEFSTRENKAKHVIEKLLHRDSINEVEADVLLDWFDKMRIGWSRVVRQNHDDDTPIDFHIKNCMRSQDRILYVAYSQQKCDDLRIPMFEDFVFRHLPSYFGLSINHLGFVSLASRNIAASPLGLPLIKFDANGHGFVGAAERPSDWPSYVQGFSILSQAIWPGLPSREQFSEAERFRLRDEMASIVHFKPQGDRPAVPFNEQLAVDILGEPFPSAQKMFQALTKLFVKVRRWRTRELKSDPIDASYNELVTIVRYDGEELARKILSPKR